MRRTYRSKKEMCGALDHKDVMQTLDEKSSAFDAFYIQNIKQTKRELSCVGSLSHYGSAANKVRKRKYVKRIVKDPEISVRNCSSHSVFLTPDKSIRVNKGQDLFDQLLNLSSPQQTESLRKNQNKFGIFPKRQENKTYTRRKLAKIKKFNCSSSDSVESDKENSLEDHGTQNVTDLQSYELPVEKQKKPSPKYLDESINEIVKNISTLKSVNFNRDTSIGSAKKSYVNTHRLTTNIQSLSNSPKCSTPFKDKYRSQSIYKFSPIANTKNDISAEYLTIVEENDSVVGDKNYESLRISNMDENPPSPIIYLSKDKSVKSEGSKTNSTSSEAQIDLSLATKVSDIKNSISVDEDVKVSNTELSDLQTTEAEPFFGFSNVKLKKSSNSLIDSSKTVEHEIDLNENDSNNDIFDEKSTSVNTPYNKMNVSNGHPLHSKDNMFADNKSTLENMSCSVIDVFNNHSLQSKEFMCKNNETVLEDASCKEINASNEHQLKSKDMFDDNQSTIEDISCNKSNVLDHSLPDSDVQRYVNESSYDTCNSDQSFEDNCVEPIRVPIIKIERLNNKLLNKYLDKISSCESQSTTDTEEASNVLDSDDYASFEDSQYSINDMKKYSDEEFQNEMISDGRESIDASDKEYDTSNDSDLNKNKEEERCISFVTTRRRNEITNDSLIFSFNNSFGSASSTDCDKTVLSNNNDETKIQASLSPQTEITEISNANPEVLHKTEQDKEDDMTKLKEFEICNNPRLSTVTTRRSSKMLRDSNIDTNSTILDEGKTGIVLQPGKKWERSLSIYRRMTMMTDHFDHTILDEDEFNNKGRKYRQSVISTMELQDKGLLHNESIISRRSTFVSNPHRSTIRIIKEPNSSRLSTSAVSDDLRGFLNEDCDETIIELSKLSIADSEHEVTVVDNFHDTSSRVSTARDYVLRRCSQNDAILFDECYPEAVLKNCRKIGEGVYGEVFLWRARDGRARVMKIVPIAGTTKVNGERQKDFQEIISEIVIAMELSALRAPVDEIQREFDEGKSIDALDLHSVVNATDVFNEVLAVRCVYGAYPSRLLDLWELYDECNGSENDNPAILPVDQQYIVLELANAGQDLESYEFNSAEQAHALFLQVAYGLAVGEESFQFEHRDLHWGNVLIAPTDQKFATFVLRGRAHRVARCGVAATIIDYSLSRLSLPLPAAGDAAALYNDLAADDGLFDAVGDYQFQVYRLMRDKLGNDWKNFEPYTNILWLHYTVDKMITALRYKRTNTKIHKHYIAKLKGIKNRLLDYGSAAQFLLTDNEL